jgi:hypothetical protein
MLVAALLAFAAAVLTAHLANRLRLTRFVAAPPLFFICMVAIYAVVFSTYVVRA